MWHTCGCKISQIQEVASANSQERGEHCRSGSDPLSKVVIAKHCLALGICEHGRRNWLVQAARSCDVLGLQFDAHDGDG